ncbi:UNVERIFIED_CONTAM: hypothetical protein FKN15_011458 [Acipenser sinensis]
MVHLGQPHLHGLSCNLLHRKTVLRCTEAEASSKSTKIQQPARQHAAFANKSDPLQQLSKTEGQRASSDPMAKPVASLHPGAPQRILFWIYFED